MSCETASKRAADTGVLLLEFGLNKPTSERAIEAIARMNFMHSCYRKSGKITNDDLLYTLSIFALEPSRWINKYEWRRLSDVEMCACGTYWKNMGDAMEISYTKLPSSAQGWQDGLQWLNEVKAWSDQYEESHMIPAKTNKHLVDSQFEYLLPNLASTYRDICKRMAVSLLGDRLRNSVMYVKSHVRGSLHSREYRYPKSPAVYHNLLSGTLLLRKALLRYLALPRPEFLRYRWIETGNDSRSRRYYLYDYLAHPWYIKPTLRRRWGPGAWMTKLLGYKLPGDDGDKYCPEGYTITDVGPEAFSGKGMQDMEKTRFRLVQADRGRCPFSPP